MHENFLSLRASKTSVAIYNIVILRARSDRSISLVIWTCIDVLASYETSIWQTHPINPSAREGEFIDCRADFDKSARNDDLWFLANQNEGAKMPIKPKSFLAKCKKCGKVEFISPKSDALTPLEVCPICEKCNTAMEKIVLPSLDTKSIGDFFKGLFKS